MQPLFIWNGFHRGDIIMTRPIVRQVLNDFDIKVTVGCYRNHAYLFDDLGVDVISSSYDDNDAGLGPLDLSYLCPADHVAINTWVGNYLDLLPPSWPTMIRAFNRQASERDHPVRLHNRGVPNIDFRFINVSVLPNAVYVENGMVRSSHSRFQFDMQRISADFPELNFYCTSDPLYHGRNLFDCSKLNLVELASVSNRCVALVGKGSGPFVCTLTTANRHKPRAIMNFHDPRGTLDDDEFTFWDYPESPLQYLDTYEDLHFFLTKVASRDKLVLV